MFLLSLIKKRMFLLSFNQKARMKLVAQVIHKWFAQQDLLVLHLMSAIVIWINTYLHSEYNHHQQTLHPAQ